MWHKSKNGLSKRGRSQAEKTILQNLVELCLAKTTIASPEKVGWQYAVLKNSDILASINGDFLDMHVTHGISSKYPQTITDAGF